MNLMAGSHYGTTRWHGGVLAVGMMMSRPNSRRACYFMLCATPYTHVICVLLSSGLAQHSVAFGARWLL